MDSPIYQYTEVRAKFFTLEWPICISVAKKVFSFNFWTKIYYKMTSSYLQISKFLFVQQVHPPCGASICPTNSFLQIYKHQKSCLIYAAIQQNADKHVHVEQDPLVNWSTMMVAVETEASVGAEKLVTITSQWQMGTDNNQL